MNKSQLQQLDWEKMRSVDPRTVDRNTLKDINDVRINKGLGLDERFCEYVSQIGNPYCYLDNGVVVKISFTGGEPFDEIVKKIIAQS